MMAAATLLLLVALVVVARWIFGFLFPRQHRGREVPTQPPPLSADQTTMVDNIMLAFPNAQRRAVERTLSQTGSAQAVIDAILEGRIPLSQSAGGREVNRYSETMAEARPTTYKAILAQIAQQKDVTATEPGNVWSKDANVRRSNLIQRKQFMIQQARARFLEQEQKEKAQQEATNNESERTADASIQPGQEVSS